MNLVLPLSETSTTLEQKQLNNGWTYTVSRWIEYLPDGTTFAGVGINPDVRAGISAADMAISRDTILDTAIADLRGQLTSTPE